MDVAGEREESEESNSTMDDDGLERRQWGMDLPTASGTATGQACETDTALTVVVCAPSALSKMMGSLHPAAALYEMPMNIQLAVEAHKAAVDMMRESGVVVHDVRDILVDDVKSSVGARMRLEDLASSCLTYTLDRGVSPSPSPPPGSSAPDSNTQNDQDCNAYGERGNLATAEQYYVSDKYKRLVIKEMDEQQLADVIFTNPTVTVSPTGRDTGFTASYKFEPLTNITFVRDQQITTRWGIVMGRLRSPQREKEVDVMQFCLKKLKLNIIGRVRAPGYLEGGDFIPAGPWSCFVGIGPRTNWAAVQYLMENDLLKTRSVAVVKDDLDRNQQRMHLDTVFNLVDCATCVVLEDIMGENSRIHRVVDEYVRVGDDFDTADTGEPKVGPYQLQTKGIEFERYLKKERYRVIRISGEQQLKYGCNLLHLGDGKIIMTEREAARVVAACPEFDGTVRWLDFRGVTCMYGGLRCATQVVKRLEKDGCDYPS